MARMLRVYIKRKKWTGRSDLFGKHPVKNTEPGWPGTEYVDFELAQFVDTAPFKIGIIYEIAKTPGIVAGSITVKRSEVSFPGMAKKSEYPMQINEDVLIVRDDNDTITFWSNSLIMVRNAFMAAIGEHYVEPKMITWGELEKSSTEKGE